MFFKCINIIRNLKEQEEEKSVINSKRTREILKYYEVMNFDNTKESTIKFMDYVIKLDDISYEKFLNYYSELTGAPKNMINIIFYNHKLYNESGTKIAMDFFDMFKVNPKLLSKSTREKYEEGLERNESIKLAEAKCIELSEAFIEVTKDTYNDLLEEKEEIKIKLKTYIRILKSLSKNIELSKTDLVILTTAISNYSDEETSSLALDEINEYKKQLELKKEQSKKEEKAEIKNQPKEAYLDDEIIIEQEEIYDENKDKQIFEIYLLVIQNMSSKEEIENYLKEISHYCDIEYVCDFLMSMLQNDSFRYNIINDYAIKLSESIKTTYDPSVEEKTIIYLDSLTGTNNIQNDLKDIPESMMPDVQKALSVFDLEDFDSKIPSIKRISKVKKIRQNDIRIAYRRIGENLYVILGIFVKKDSKGKGIINSIYKRNELLNQKKYKAILEKNILFKEKLEKNSEIQETINQKLNSNKSKN